MCGCLECEGNTISHWLHVKKLERCFLVVGGTLRNWGLNLMLADLGWKMASTYFEFVLKVRTLRGFSSPRHMFTSILSCRRGNTEDSVPGFVLEALKSQGHRLISGGEWELGRRKKASIST